MCSAKTPNKVVLEVVLACLLSGMLAEKYFLRARASDGSTRQSKVIKLARKHQFT